MITAKVLLATLLQTSGVAGLPADTSNVDLEQAYCLAQNIYFESRSESVQGQHAVASTTLNRANDARFPSTVCGVVKQFTVSRSTNTKVCAFSWYCDNSKQGKEISVKNKDGSINQQAVKQFNLASVIAINALAGELKDNTQGATHFHNPSVSRPSWTAKLIKTAKWGNHDFYRLPTTR